MTREHIHFVTGRLAEFALRQMLEGLAPQVDFEMSVGVLPITVAALMTPQWIAKHVSPPPETTQVLVPGYCHGDLAPIQQKSGLPVVLGPRDLRQLDEFFGKKRRRSDDYGAYDIEILGEINHTPRLTFEQILTMAAQMREDGANLIDVGCEPNSRWPGVSDCVKMLRDAGHRVSIDSLNPEEIEPAVKAGAELVLSVNSTNVDAATQWGCEVVAIPDEFPTLGGLERTITKLSDARVPLRIDAILEPIGFGFAASLERYMRVRQMYPDAEMMMGIGNLTELTDVDSAGVNVLLLAICQELGIRSVLTTQVINWAKTSVKECDLARRLVYHSIKNRVPPKHLEPQLVMLRDPKLREFASESLEKLATSIKDNSYRIFAQEGEVHLIGAGLHLHDRDPFVVFEKLINPHFGSNSGEAGRKPAKVDPSHAFYLGYEMAKAATALQLGKQYEQDEALRWGMLTVEEESHRLKKAKVDQDASEGTS